VDVLAKRIARITGANWEDLKQEGAIGLIRAIPRFDPGRGTPFRIFAKHYIYGAIFDSSELTRNMARRQDETYRRVRQIFDELAQKLQRNPTIEEVAEKTGLRIEQILNAIDARGVAFAAALPDDDVTSTLGLIESPRPERRIFLLEALASLKPREKEIIHCYYLEGQPQEEIARKLGLTVANVTKIRQRALGKLRKLL
jgi:RNA polymerase sigma factor (sigma-70 family)